MQTLAAIETAIRDSPLQLSPRKEGPEVLVHIPRYAACPDYCTHHKRCTSACMPYSIVHTAEHIFSITGVLRAAMRKQLARHALSMNQH